MTGELFEVSDKVVLKPWRIGTAPVVPRLVPGRVYCVEHAHVSKGMQYVRLVGVRRDRRSSLEDREANIIALAFALAGPKTNAQS